MNKKIIEQKISEFSGIDFKLGKAVVIDNEDGTLTLHNINARNAKETYILDTETLDVLDQVE